MLTDMASEATNQHQSRKMPAQSVRHGGHRTGEASRFVESEQKEPGQTSPIKFTTCKEQLRSGCPASVRRRQRHAVTWQWSLAAFLDSGFSRNLSAIGHQTRGSVSTVLGHAPHSGVKRDVQVSSSRRETKMFGGNEEDPVSRAVTGTNCSTSGICHIPAGSRACCGLGCTALLQGRCTQAGATRLLSRPRAQNQEIVSTRQDIFWPAHLAFKTKGLRTPRRVRTDIKSSRIARFTLAHSEQTRSASCISSCDYRR